MIRERKCCGGFILTASHNPGGPDGDFGLKYNCSNGGPAPSSVTEAIYKITTEIQSYKIAEQDVTIDFSVTGEHTFGPMAIEVIDAPTEYARMCKSIFNFDALAAFVARYFTTFFCFLLIFPVLVMTSLC